MTISISLSGRPLTDGMFDLLSQIEQSANEFNPNIHDDGRGVPTIGYGYALVVQGANNSWSNKATLVADLQMLGIAFSATQMLTLAQIVTFLNQNDAAGQTSAGDLIPELAGGTQPITPQLARP